MRNFNFKLIFSFLLLIFSLNSFAQNNSSNYQAINIEVQFIRTGVDGTILFKVFSYGKNFNKVLENSKADAIKAVLFKGIPGSDLQRPLVTDSQLSNSQITFFDDFFKTKKYLQYVSISSDGSIDGEDRVKVGRQYKIGVVVSVQKANLRKLLEDSGIVKALDSGF